jgi:hypothetical protein
MSEFPAGWSASSRSIFLRAVPPNILIRLRSTRVGLEQLTHGLQRDTLTAKPNGRWSFKKMGVTGWTWKRCG